MVVSHDRRTQVGRAAKVTVTGAEVDRGCGSGVGNVLRVLDSVTVGVDAFNPSEVTRDSLEGFVEGEGVVSIESEHYSSKTDTGARRWVRIEDYGHTLSAMRATARSSCCGLVS